MAHIVDQLMSALKTVKEMLQDRGMDADRLYQYSDTEIKVMLAESPIFDLFVSDTMKVIFCVGSKFRVKDLSGVIDETITKVIIITREPVTSTNMKSYIEEYSDIDTQFFHLSELQFNISKHFLVPNHERIHDAAAIVDIINKFNVKTKAQFPAILRTDPMARYIDAKPGDLVKITRPSVTAGEYITYRVCA
jgi:DNA-directed RNA polymerase I, II, and III subunit RPABC1